MSIGIFCHQRLAYLKGGAEPTTVANPDFKCVHERYTGYTYAIVSNNTYEQKLKIVELSSNASSSEDVETLLDHINWRLFLYSSNNNTCSSYTLIDNCSNEACCVTDSVDEIILNGSYCENSANDCSSTINSYPVVHWYIFFVFGLISVIGNLIVIHDKAKNLTSNRNENKEIKIYYTLVLNLALSDLLMGVYLTAISLEIKQKVKNNYHFSKSAVCSALGIINALSSQVSITVLFIISLYRLMSVVRPYKTQRLKLVIVLLSVTWTTWLGLAVLPVLPWEPFKSFFTIGITKDYRLARNSYIEYIGVVNFVDKLLSSSCVPNNITEIQSILYAVNQYRTTSVLNKFVAAVGWLGTDQKQWSEVEYYRAYFSCAMNYIAPFDYDFSYFPLVYSFFNLIISIAIVIHYSILMYKMIRNGVAVSTFVCSCISCQCLMKNPFLSDSSNVKRHTENQTLFKRISIMVVTDLLCWIPLSIASLVVSNNFINKSEKAADTMPVYITFESIVLFVVPFNSVLNPGIYSYHLWERWFRKLKSKLCSKQKQITKNSINNELHTLKFKNNGCN